jgi:subtilase family serine protease
MSWGWPEPNQCGTVLNCTKGETSYQYVERTNVEFQKVGLRGITLLAASGDQGFYFYFFIFIF